ncbi:acyl-CoA dehydrogenase family protein [Mycolicibacterium elephantis]
MVADLTAEHRSLRDLARQFLDQRAGEPAVRSAMETPTGFDAALWREFANLGMCGLAVPARYGGEGCGPAEVAIVMRELGRALAPLPFFSSVALAQSVVLNCGDDDACARLLPELVTGRLIATVALVEPSWNWDPQTVRTTASQHDPDWRLTGTKSFVVDGASADIIFLAARTSAGISLFEVRSTAPGLTRTALTTIDQTRRLARIDMEETPARQVGTAGAAIDIMERALMLANIYLAAESVGATEHVLHSAVDYAKNRKQFGRAIGSFQAIKHKCADMHVEFETARCTAEHAVAAVASGNTGDAVTAASVAAALCHEAFHRCAAENIQIHGGIGFTWEHHAHLYYKRAQSNRVLLGDATHHRRSLGASLGLLANRA